MNCVIQINDREALPVRAIPFVTGWSLSPDMVANSLADPDRLGQAKHLRACSLAPDGSHNQMLPKEWLGIMAALQALSKILKAEEKVECTSYPVWRERSIDELPSHCFVWRDEFEQASLTIMQELCLDVERHGEKELNFSPWIPVQLIDIVFEGFETTRPHSAADKDVTLKPNQNRESNALQLLRQAHMKWWANANSQDPSTHPVNRDVAAWLTERGLSHTLSNKAAMIIRPEWAHKGRKPDT